MPMPGWQLAAFAFVSASFASAACGARPPAVAPALPQVSPPAAAASNECALIPEPGEAIATLALTERVDPANAPRPSNQSERLLFRQLFETLVRVDCLGRVVSSLAAAWRLEPDGRTWILTLRENARFADGTPLTAADVRASWTREGGESLRAGVSRFVAAVAVAGDRDLAVTLRRPRPDAPIALADPDLAIAKRVAGSQWPLGTRPGWLALADGTVTRDGLPPLRLLIAPGDPRDLLDRDTDLLLTRDPAAIQYAATLSQFQSVPLPWQRTHVLLTPARTRSAPSLSPEARQALADDAVRGEARGALGPFWWEALEGCEVMPASAPAASPPVPRIVYDADDAAARDLAARLVGLGAFPRAAGLSGEALAAARRAGADAGYVLPVDSRPVEPCGALQALMDGTPWLELTAIVPLVDTRLQAIVRRGRTAGAVEWDGGLLIGVRTASDR